jgi:mannose-6-phosphate isomerase-like protein (cupin superfamily)
VARRGDVLENPATGERILFHATAEETGGELLRYEAVFTPRGIAARLHVHPRQEERHEVLAGILGMTVDGRAREVYAGDVVVVSAGVPHRLWDTGSGPVHAVFELRPALRWEALFETAVGLAREGRVNRHGEPTLLQLAVLAREYEDEVQLARPPLTVQRAALAPLARLGVLLGHRARYDRYSGPEQDLP